MRVLSLLVLLPLTLPGLLLVAGPASAQEQAYSQAGIQPNPQGIQAQREAFTPLLNAAENGRLQAHPETAASLSGYALYDYLTVADLIWRLRNQASSALDQEIENFLNQHPRLPPAAGLRSRWIFSLARRDNWPLVQRLTADAEDTRFKCLNIRARIAQQQTAGLAEDAASLWLVGRSQPDDCDDVFAWMRANGEMTPTRIIERARLAIVERNTSLANYLSRKLDNSARDTVQRWVALLGSPVDIKFASALDPDVAVAVFKRLALQNVDAAAQLQAQLAERLKLGPAQVYEMRRYLGLLYAQNHRPEALAWFERIDDTRMDDYSREWRIRAALLHGRWQLALDWINSLPPTQASDETWRYWRARALSEMDQADQAKAGFTALAQERSYYGYLAADQIGANYSFNSQPLTSNPALAAQLAADPAVARARELHTLEMEVAANREWNTVTAELPAPMLQEAALLAHQWGWHFQAIITLAKSDYWDDLNIRYPLLYADLVRSNARTNRLDPAYVLAIVRTESLFRPAVHSPANAVGLMQLLPATARSVARKIGAPSPSVADLEIPATNVPLGTGYLREQLDRFDNNVALSSAAYNAGPHRVSRWLKEVQHPVAADVWVENIPYNETRGYVQSAMSHMTVFQMRLEDDITRVSQRISPISPDSETQQ